MKAINLFSHSGGVAQGAYLHGIQTNLYTTHTLPFKSLIQGKIRKGQLPEGAIHKFAYNIRSDEVKDTADLLIGLVTADIYQHRENTIPNEKGLFSSALRTREDAARTHSKTLHEISLLAKASGASKLIFFFTYHPNIDKSLSILTSRGFQVKVYEFACTGPLNPCPYLYCLVADLTVIEPEVETGEEEENLTVCPLLQHVDTSKTITTPMSQIQRVVLWDLAPCIVDQVLQRVLKDEKKERRENYVYKNNCRTGAELLGLRQVNGGGYFRPLPPARPEPHEGG